MKEYKVVDSVMTADESVEGLKEDLTDKFNEMARDGWELAATLPLLPPTKPGSVTGALFIFTREAAQ